MSFDLYKNKLESLQSSYDSLMKDNKPIKENKIKLKNSLQELQKEFSSVYTNCINELDYIINSINEKHQALEDINANHDNTEESPAAAKPLILWPNFEKLWTHNKTLRECTFTLSNVLPACFRIPIRVIKGTTSCIVLGVSINELNTTKRYLGGDMGLGSWGIAGNASLGEDGKWSNGNGYKEGDIVTIEGNNGVISYHINDEPNEYKYDMKTSTLFLGVTLNKGDQLELLV